MIQRRQSGIELGIVIGEGGLRIDVKRSSVLLDQVRKRDVLAEEFTTDIAKRVHLRVLCHREDPEINRGSSPRAMNRKVRPAGRTMKKGGGKLAAFMSGWIASAESRTGFGQAPMPSSKLPAACGKQRFLAV